jgi:DNA-binding NarL/FixJ family response regulator
MGKEFDRIVNSVAEAMDMMPFQVTSPGMFKEQITARWLVVKLLAEKGFYTHQIAARMNMTERNVNIILKAVKDLSSRDENFVRKLEMARKSLNS